MDGIRRLGQSSLLLCLLSPALVMCESQEPTGPVTVSGELREWHKITLTLDGPATSESATPNPFTDYRLDVTFSNGEREYVVPGYYAADGDAANTGADSGNKWRVHVAPDEPGDWVYRISFLSGENVATAEPGTGTPVVPLHGHIGGLDVSPTNKHAATFNGIRDNRGRGRLQYVGERYLRWAGEGGYFLKQGTDSPENLLAYADFDGDFASDGHKDNLVKTWAPHVRDWYPGDPTWGDGRGKGLVGALNYIASKGMNSVSFLTLNIGGDDRNVFPYTSYDERERFDVSRLDQWEIVFEHADHVGLYLHFKTQETENETLLDGGDTGPQRKLYYRELIARFGHHLALNWNLGEEDGWGANEKNRQTDQSTGQRIAMAKFFHDHDPYHHLIVIHNGLMPDDLLGDASELTGFSLQTNRTDFRNVHGRIVEWIRRSADAGKPWVVACDEPGDAQHSLIPDEEDPGHDDARINGLWGCLLGGGAGNEWYFGYAHPHSDLTCQDWRTRAKWWDQCRIALEFFHEHLPFQRMASHDELAEKGTGFCFAAPGEIYAILVRPGKSTTLDLGEAEGVYNVRWFDPRLGFFPFVERWDSEQLRGPGNQPLGPPPREPDKDWIALVERIG